MYSQALSHTSVSRAISAVGVSCVDKFRIAAQYCRLLAKRVKHVDAFTADPIKALHFAILV